MSGFAVVYERSNTPVDTGVLNRILHKLDHRGPDGLDYWQTGPIAMGHQHFWTTPEEVGEHQPLIISGIPYTIVMDGRLDNREDIIHRLKIDSEDAKLLSDANIILQAYARWNTDCFTSLLGEFAAVIWDHRTQELVCVRDSVGDRTLFYTLQGQRVLIASEPWALASSISGKCELDERAVAHHFALQVPKDGQTLFEGILELLPAHWLKVTPNKEYQEIYWQPTIEKRTAKRSDQDYVEEFRDVLETSVRCRLRSTTAPAIMMSGGLDSTSVACLAARIVSPTPITTFSYVFDEFTESDERKYINSVRDLYNAQSIQIPCDDLLPFKTWPEWQLDPNCPPMNPYRPIIERTYSRMQEEGFRVLLSGMYGDNLYLSAKDWLADLFLEGRIGQLSQELFFQIRKHGLVKTFESGIIRHTLNQILLKIPGVYHFRHNPQAPNWATSYCANYLDKKSDKRNSSKLDGLFSMYNAMGNTREFYYTNQHKIELRSPYRDQRLLEFVLSLPGYLLYSKGTSKRILRMAMRGIIPDSIHSRIDHTNLLSIYNFSVQQKKAEILRSFEGDDAAWRKYVKSGFVLKEWDSEVTKQNDGSSKVVPSLCLFYDIWYKSIQSSGFFGGCNGR